MFVDMDKKTALQALKGYESQIQYRANGNLVVQGIDLSSDDFDKVWSALAAFCPRDEILYFKDESCFTIGVGKSAAIELKNSGLNFQGSASLPSQDVGR